MFYLFLLFISVTLHLLENCGFSVKKHEKHLTNHTIFEFCNFLPEKGIFSVFAPLCSQVHSPGNFEEFSDIDNISGVCQTSIILLVWVGFVLFVVHS